MSDAKRLLGCLDNLLVCGDNRRDGVTAYRADCVIDGVNCHLAVSDPGSVVEKLSTMAKAGADSLELISDFDCTLTKFEHNGLRVPTSHRVLETCKLLSETDRIYLANLVDKYYQIEICQQMTDDEKTPHLVEWWTKSHDTLIQAGFRRDVIADSVAEAGILLRSGWRRLFNLLEEHNMPCLVFSAGVGNVIEEVLRQSGIRVPTVRIVSNMMVFDEQGLLTGFSRPLIHTLNKTFAAFAGSSSGSECGITCRPHLLLLGDSLGDLRMREGAEARVVLTVGYLNDRCEERLEEFAAAYDIVCVRDESLGVPNAIVDAVAMQLLE